ncbi:hypothetical protein BKA83DRAFT_4129463 [Pisolithus microcarpus]|nr:hypothetical protein BKA83DRAFT_4129463 [Pisolithus microcarpus]
MQACPPTLSWSAVLAPCPTPYMGHLDKCGCCSLHHGWEGPSPPILWIGSSPSLLRTRKEAHIVAVHCQELLKWYRMTDINLKVESRDSIVTWFTSLKLLKSVCSADPMMGIQGGLTPILGLQIAAQATPNIKDTGLSISPMGVVGREASLS